MPLCVIYVTYRERAGRRNGVFVSSNNSCPSSIVALGASNTAGRGAARRTRLSPHSLLWLLALDRRWSNGPTHSPTHSFSLHSTGDDDASRLILAIQKPRIAATGTTPDAGNYATVKFNSGPNAGGQYSIQCYGVADPDAAPRSCAELEGLAPEASLAPQDLPKMYGTVSNDVTGLFTETVDCYVWADGVTGLVDKCQWMGRTDGPWDAYIADNGVTVRCPGIANGGTFVLDGVEYTKRDRAGLDEIVANSGRWSELPTSCTTGVDDMSQLFEGKATINENLSSWDTGAVTNMGGMFRDATLFNNGDPGNNGANPLDAWDTTKVEDMSDMFYFADAFNQDVSDWNTGAVTNMHGMFA